MNEQDTALLAQMLEQQAEGLAKYIDQTLEKQTQALTEYIDGKIEDTHQYIDQKTIEVRNDIDDLRTDLNKLNTRDDEDTRALGKDLVNLQKRMKRVEQALQIN